MRVRVLILPPTPGEGKMLKKSLVLDKDFFIAVEQNIGVADES